ncbi:MAG: MFS transporter [Parcubacteria group bacterium]|jgi:MFS family permease
MFLDKKIATRNFRLFLTGQAISFTGSWLQYVALTWLVLKITHSSFWVGIVSGLPLITSAFLVCLGGIIADKFKKKNILYITQSAQMIQAFLLGFLVITEKASLPIIVILAFFLGVASAIDRPARMAFIPEIVGNCRIKSAMTISNIIGQMAKVIGPGIAGFLLTFTGIGWIFVINGVSFLAVIATLPMIIAKRSRRSLVANPFEMFWSGMKYSATEPKTRLYLILSALIAVAGFAYRPILPNFSVDLLNAGPGTLGWLFAFVGLGSGVGSFLVLKKELSPCLIAGGSFFAGISLFLLPMLVPSLISGFGLLFLSGAGFAISSLTAKILIQIIVGQEMRGRVSGILIAATNGGTALGHFAMGSLASNFGCSMALSTNGIFLLLVAGFAFAATRKGSK